MGHLGTEGVRKNAREKIRLLRRESGSGSRPQEQFELSSSITDPRVGRRGTKKGAPLVHPWCWLCALALHGDRHELGDARFKNEVVMMRLKR